MGDTAGQLPDGFDLLRLPQPLLHRAPVRHIGDDARKAHGFTLLIKRLGIHPQPPNPAVETLNPGLELYRAPILGLLERRSDPLAILGKVMLERIERRPIGAQLAVTKNLVMPQRTVLASGPEVVIPTAHARRIERELQTALYTSADIDFGGQLRVAGAQLVAAQMQGRQVAHDTAEHRVGVEVDAYSRQRYVDRDLRAVDPAQCEFTRGIRAGRLLQHVVEGRARRIGEPRADGCAHDALGPRAHEARKPLVAVQNRAFRTDGDGTVLHLLDQRAVGAIGILEGVDLLSDPSPNHDRIDLAIPNGGERFIGLPKPLAQI